MKTKDKNKIKFETDLPDLKDVDIDKHKNFNNLMHEYHDVTKPLYKTPLYKNKKVFLAVLLIVIVIYLVYEASV